MEEMGSDKPRRQLSITQSLLALIAIIVVITVLSLSTEFYFVRLSNEMDQHVVGTHLRSTILVGEIQNLLHAQQEQVYTMLAADSEGADPTLENHRFLRSLRSTVSEIEQLSDEIESLVAQDDCPEFFLDLTPFHVSFDSLKDAAQFHQVFDSSLGKKLELFYEESEALSEAHLAQYAVERASQRETLARMKLWLAVIFGALYLAGFLATLYLFFAIRRLAQRESDLVDSLRLNQNELETRVAERTRELAKTHTALVDASRKAGMAEVATGVLHNIGNVLNSVNISADMMMQKLSHTKIARIHEAGTRIRKRMESTSNGHVQDPTLIKLLDYVIAASDTQISLEKEMCDESADLKRHIDSIKSIVDSQQQLASYAGTIESVLPRHLVDQALGLYRKSLERDGVEIVVEHGYDHPIRMDKSKLLQILTNLIVNARDAIAMSDRNSGHRLRITTRPEAGESICFEVEDTGNGIHTEHIHELFAHGFTTKPDGHGFGLHSSALHARDLGGELRAYSDGANRGACFKLRIPRKAKEKVEC